MGLASQSQKHSKPYFDSGIDIYSIDQFNFEVFDCFTRNL